MEIVIGKTFKNTTVNLDFSTYDKCSFINCTIHSDYGIFRLANNDFTHCKLSLGQPARNIAYLVKQFSEKRS
ncbi:MAG: hypothetical protein JSV85_04425 [Candidatus Bathyarchaeota archaeon]|nr:MAG: hypothetical protein JSV85_04425 [Candidatus Bathyarchaeota archaeon]